MTEPQTSWEILGTYQGEEEVIDEADTKQEAEFLVGEYYLAYAGQGWTIKKRRKKLPREDDAA